MMTKFNNSQTKYLTNWPSIEPATLRKIIAAFVITAYLILSLHTPIALDVSDASDSNLFLALGNYLASGQWLGPYGPDTLAKGPGYPLFLAVNSWIGLPVGLSQAVLQCIGISLFFWVFARIFNKPNIAIIGFIFTLFAPAQYLEHVLRGAIYPGQTLLVFAALTYTLCGELKPKARIGWAIVTGLATGWMLLTREEGIWIAPGVAVLVLYNIWLAWKTHTLVPNAIAPLLTIFFTVITVQAGFKLGNRIVYGRFTSVEVNSAPFKNALGALQSVEAGPRIPYVAVSRKARFAIYSVSPTFRSLKDYFDPVNGKTPWQYGCLTYPTTCGDIGEGWFMWALREAVYEKGYYSSPKRAAKFYRKLTAEVTQACHDNRLKCSPSFIALWPHISAAQWRNLPSRMLFGIQLITDENPATSYPGPSSGSAESIEAALAFLGNPVTTKRTNLNANNHEYHIQGWYRAPAGGWISGKIQRADNQYQSIAIPRIASPDIVSAFNDPGASQDRFDFTITCGTPCRLSFVNDDDSSIRINLGKLAGERFYKPLGKGTLNIDAISDISTSNAYTDIPVEKAKAMHRSLRSAYSIFLPWLAMLALLAIVITAVFTVFARRLHTITVIAVAIWALITSRILLLGIIDISSFHGIQVRLLAPAYPLVCLAVVVSLSAFQTSFRGALEARHGRVRNGS